jgi:predicted Zn-dependent protease with MMP-like domain
MHIYKKSVLFFIIAVLVSGTFAVAPQKAHAQFGVIVIDDLFFNVKEALDSVAWGVAKSIIGQMQGSILQWASTGFDGNPVFIQDPALYLQNIGKSTANGFIEAIGPLIHQCEHLFSKHSHTNMIKI